MQTSTQFLRVPAWETIIDRKFITVSPETTIVDVLTLVNCHSTQYIGEYSAPKMGLLENSQQLNLVTSTVARQQPTQCLNNKKLANYILTVTPTKLIGILSIQDLQILRMGNQDLGTTKIAEVVRPTTIALKLSSQQDSGQILSLLQQHQLHYLPVIDSQSQPIGVISYKTIGEALQSVNGQEKDNLADSTLYSQLQYSSLIPPPESPVSHHSLQLLELLNPIVETITGKLRIKQVLPTITNQIRALFNISSCVIWLHNNSQPYLSETNLDQSSLLDFSCQIAQHYHQSLTQGEPIILPKINGNCPVSLRQLAHNYQIYASLVIPLIYQGSYLGSLCLHHDSVREWDGNEISFSRIIAAHCAVAIYHSHLAEASSIPAEAIGINITEHKKALEAMQESEERFRLLADNAPVLIWMSNEKNQCTFFNKTWLDFRGRTLEQEQDNGWTQGIHPEDLQHCLLTYTSVLDNHHNFELEYRLRRADGEYRWLMNTGVPRFTHSGDFAGYIGSCLDITARKQVEEALRDSEAHYRLVVEDQTELICRFKPNYHLTFVNQAYCRYFGKERSQLLAHSFLPLLLPEEQTKIIDCLRSLTHQEPTREVENLIVTPQGEVYWQHWTYRAIFNEQHQLIEFQGVGQDITERVRAQQALEEANEALEAMVNERTAALNESNKYLRSEIVKRFSLTRQLKDSQHKLRDTRILQQAILDSTSYSIMATSPTGVILTFNRAAEKLLGYRAQEVIGRTTPILFHDSAEINQRLQQLEQENWPDLRGDFDVVVAKARQGELEEREWTYIRQDGHRFPVLLSVTPLYNATDKLSGFLVIGRDITASKQAQENLRLRERAMAASNNGIVIAVATEPDLPVIYANKAFEKITGYSPAEIMGCNCRLLQDDDNNQPELDILRQALREHRSCTVVLRNYRKDGTPFWNELSVSPIYDSQGNLTHYIGIQNDITVRRNAVEELEKAKAQLQAVLDAVPGMVSWVDANCRYLGVNQHLAHTYNRPPQAFVGQSVNFLKSSWEFHDLMKRFFATNAQKVTREIKTKVEGQFRNYLVAAQKYQQGNAAVTVGIDITTLKQTEEELRTATSRLSALIENLQAGVVVEDELGRIVLINQVFCDIFDIAVVPGALIGADFTNFPQEYKHHCTQPTEFVQRYQEILKMRKVVTDEEIQFADGRTFERDYVPIIVADNYCGHLWMYSDITERKHSEAELRQALRKEKELSELKSRFVTNTSHEFRTPLTTILSSSELLEHYRHQWTEEKQLTHIHRIQKSVKHMTQLLNDILIIGKAEAGRLEFKPVLINLELFCQELAEELQLNGKNHHRIFLNHQGHCSQVLLDEKLLRHILTNLLSNAMKYSPGESTIELFFACQDDQLVLCVRDQGIGIPELDQAHLFESFHRATNVGNIQGTGLGLSIVNKCVQVHGGEISLHSQVGQGTTFTVKLPLNS